jgi:hypothetical protein
MVDVGCIRYKKNTKFYLENPKRVSDHVDDLTMDRERILKCF